MHHKQKSSFPSRFSGENKVLQLSLQSNRIELGSWFRMEVSSKWKLEVMANKIYTRNNFLKHLSQQVDLRTNTALSNLWNIELQVYISFHRVALGMATKKMDETFNP